MERLQDKAFCKILRRHIPQGIPSISEREWNKGGHEWEEIAQRVSSDARDLNGQAELPPAFVREPV